MVRSFTKWDAEPKTVDEALVAIQRAYNEAITPPMGPTLVVLSSEIQKVNSPNVRIPAYTAAAISDHRCSDGAGSCQELARGRESEDRGGPLANARRCEARSGAGRTGGSVDQHRGDAGADEFSAAASVVRPGRGHRNTITRWAWRRPARRPPSRVRQLATVARARDTTNIDFGGILKPSNFGRQGGVVKSAHADRGGRRGEPAAADRRSEAPIDAGAEGAGSRADGEARASQSQRARGGAGAGRGSGEGGLERVADEHGADLCRAVAADHARRLVFCVAERIFGRAQRAVVGAQQALQLPGRTGRGRHGLRRASRRWARVWRPRRAIGW